MRRYDGKPARLSLLEETNVAVWGVGRWDAARGWGRGDPQREPLVADPYGGIGHWGRHCWATDFWVRW